MHEIHLSHQQTRKMARAGTMPMKEERNFFNRKDDKKTSKTQKKILRFDISDKQLLGRLPQQTKSKPPEIIMLEGKFIRNVFFRTT